MSKDALNQDLDRSPEVQTKFAELAALLAKHGFGVEGPPRETTFAEIEGLGHRARRMLGRALDVPLGSQHATHFADQEACPGCGEEHLPKDRPQALSIETDDGPITLQEPAFRCPPCERDFFPSAYPAQD